MFLRFGRIIGAAWLMPAAAFAAQPVLAAKDVPKPVPVVQDYKPKPGLWLLADEDTKIYLFGTIHMLPPGFKWRSPAFDKVAAEADELVVETASDADGSLDAAMLIAILLKEPVPILERVPADKRPALKAAIEKGNVPLQAMSMIRTWMVAVTLGLADSLDGWGVEDSDEAPGVEDVLEAEFRAAKKPIGSVESPQAALDAFNAMPEFEQRAMLLDTIAALGEDEDEAEAAEAEDDNADDHLWAKGRFDEAYAIYMKDFPPLLYDGLVRKRNAAWTLWLAERLKKPGTVLFAVGAAHLAGPDSVQAMLAKNGLQAKRVN
ncbi:MAG TPA: TraB/GumN family protein [Allosphingosinicella sp.]|jgi:hypothetical protein